MKHARYPNFSALALVLGTIALVGCGGMATVSNSTSTDTPPPAGAPAAQVVAGPAIKGSVFGGHAPLQGAHVYLVQPGITGYGSAATSLLGTGTTTSPDGFTLMSNPSGMTKDPNVPVGAMFEVSDSGGNFNFTGAYSCTVGMPVYIYAWGGAISSTAVNNESIVQLATLGNCPSSGNFSTAGNGALQFVYLNEVSTIATAYTFQPFTLVGNNSAWDIGIPNPATHPQALTGIQNAAATAAQLYDIQGATQLSTGLGEPDGEGHIANFQTVGNGSPNSGNGVVPQATIDSLANIVANCVDSAPATLGAQTAQCSGLFAIATNNGEIGTAANEPVDTGTAAINIARFPAGNSSDGAANVDAHYASHIFNLPSGTVPYQPALTAAPNDWTLAINYPGLTPVVGSAGKVGVSNGTLNLAESLAIDNSGQVWITSQGEPNGTGGFTIVPDIVRWSNLGEQNVANTFPYIPGYVSVDGSGNAWTGNANCSPTNTVCATGTPILFAGNNGQLDTNLGGGYFDAYVVVANNAGDAFFFASNSTLTPDFGMWEYDASQNLVAGSPFNCCGATSTNGTEDLTILGGYQTTGTGNYTFNYTAGAGPALAVGDVVNLALTNDPGTGTTPVAATGWPGLTSVTVAKVNSSTQFTATSDTTPTPTTTNTVSSNTSGLPETLNISSASETNTGGANPIFTYTFNFPAPGGPPLAVGDTVSLALANDPGTGADAVAATGWPNLKSVTVASVNSATNPTSFTATGTTPTTNSGGTGSLNITNASETHTGGNFTYTFTYTTNGTPTPLAMGDTVNLTLTNDAGTGADGVAATGWNNLKTVTVATTNGTNTFTASGTIPTANSGGTGSLNITGVTETNTGGKNPTFTYTFAATNTGANPLVAGNTVTLTLNSGKTNPGGFNWDNVKGTFNVVSATTTHFVITSTVDGGNTGNFNGGTAAYATPTTNGATGTGAYAIPTTNGATGTGGYFINGATGAGTFAFTTTTHATGAIPSGDNVAHGAIDADGDLWITAEVPGNTIARVTPTGAAVFTPITLTNTNNTNNENQPEFPAIDNSGNAWIALQETDSQILKVSPSGGTTILTATGGNSNVTGTTTATTATGALMTSTFGAAVDGNGNVWFANRAGNYGVVNTGTGAAVAGENTIFVLNGGAGTPGIENTAISPTTNYVPEAQYPATTTDKFTPLLDGSLNLAIDPSGNVWITNYSGGGVTEIIGAAAPVVTPLSVAAGNGQLGQKP